MKRQNLMKKFLTSMMGMAMAAAIFFGSSVLEAKAMTIDEFASFFGITAADVQASPDLYDLYNFLHENNISLLPGHNSGPTPNIIPPGRSEFDAVRYGAENPDVAAAFGQDVEALYNHYTTYGINEGRKAYYTDGTAIAVPGVPSSQPGMLPLVNADRAATNGSAPLVWNTDLEAYALARVPVVLANFQSPEYAAAMASGAPTAPIAHRGLSDSMGENALWASISCETVQNANAGWIGSSGHHTNRVTAEYTQYAAASYIDPVTLEESWIELFQY